MVPPAVTHAFRRHDVVVSELHCFSHAPLTGGRSLRTPADLAEQMRVNELRCPLDYLLSHAYLYQSNPKSIRTESTIGTSAVTSTVQLLRADPHYLRVVPITVWVNKDTGRVVC